MDNNDQAIKMTELVIEALNFANSDNLDINSKDDVEKILDAIDPERFTINDVGEFMQMLQASNNFIEKDVERRRSIN